MFASEPKQNLDQMGHVANCNLNTSCFSIYDV